jgi:hypothetical protein
MSRKNTCPAHFDCRATLRVKHKMLSLCLTRVNITMILRDSEKQHDTLVSCDPGQSVECFIDFIRNSARSKLKMELIRHDVLQSIEKSSQLSYTWWMQTRIINRIFIFHYETRSCIFLVECEEVKIAENPLERNEIDWFNGIKKRWQKYSFINFWMLCFK